MKNLKVRYISSMMEVVKKYNVQANELYPPIIIGDDLYILKTTMELNDSVRDSKFIYIYHKDYVSRHKTFIKDDLPEHQKRELAMKEIIKTLISLNKKVNPNKEIYIMWATDTHYEIRYVRVEDLVKMGRVYQTKQDDQSLMVLYSEQLVYPANIAIAIGTLVMVAIFFIMFFLKVLEMRSG